MLVLLLVELGEEEEEEELGGDEVGGDEVGGDEVGGEGGAISPIGPWKGCTA